MIYGEQDHSKYLGCLNCSEFFPESVHNKFGQYGSDFSPISIHNDFGQYGSKFSPYSACNNFASYPPAIVDETGNFYGYLTLNKLLPRASNNQEILSWLTYRVCSK